MISNAEIQDGEQIHRINSDIPIFSEEEVACVDELWQEYRSVGADKCGYYFLVDKEDNNVLGYACYGPRALTSGTYDLYWIAVDPKLHHGGVGRKLLAACEQAIRDLGGRLLIVETSGLPVYESTRKFYHGTDYAQEAVIKDFYKPGDDLVIFTKHL